MARSWPTRWPRTSLTSARRIATLDLDAPTITDVGELRWTGPTDELTTIAERFDAPDLVGAAAALATSRRGVGADPIDARPAITPIAGTATRQMSPKSGSWTPTSSTSSSPNRPTSRWSKSTVR
ncbi:MAG: hypothetical protein R2710_10075 [Acidimicrobiales bacterium]